MIEKREPADSVKIYISGDIGVITERCRKHCMDIGACFTITPTNFVYTGGEESGACIGLVNYPRFPSTPNDIEAEAYHLAKILIEAAHQWTALIDTPNETIWLSRREENEDQ